MTALRAAVALVVVAAAAGSAPVRPRGGALAAQAAGPSPDSAAATGVRCAEQFTPIFDAKAGVLRCRRTEVRWVVTVCSDSAYAAYRARPGPDQCLPTPLPGVGAAPGVRGTRPIACAAPGYPVMQDRVGDRDRCEQVQEVYSRPMPATSRDSGGPR